MIPSCDQLSDTNFSGQKKMEEDHEGDLSLVECLRGRLLAERAASKAAKQDEHLMDSKLRELEAQLRNETKARKRFEKKLNFLKKKLQSLKIPNNLEDSEGSTRSSSLDNNSESSCISSIASTDDPQQQEAISQSEQFPKLPISNISSDQTSESPSDEFQTFQECPSQETSQIDKESEDSETDSSRPKLEMEDHNEDTSKSQDDNYEVDDSMALVPLSFPEEYSDAKEVVKITSENRCKTS
ncbi:hypothetical protein V2J09_006746 [Rumex salicifolius]